MKKVMLSSTIVTSVGLILIVIAAILKSVVISANNFDVAFLTTAFDSTGYLAAVLGGVLLTSMSIVEVVKGKGDAKKLTMASVILTVVGVTLVLAAAILNAVRGSINTVDFTINNIAAVMSQIGYLTAILAGVLLTSMTVAGVVKEGK
ncbi:MAG: hypothetical protein LBG88_02550 [Christensenellaceae bacterium]|jgi:hypothetical protein|nr:hypothetical protein [Christensenellaceae bacterium]